MFEIVDVAASDPLVVNAARHLLEHALPAYLADDRFDDRWADAVRSPDTRFHGVVAIADGHPVGYLGGSVENGRLALDSLVADHGGSAPREVFDRLLARLCEREVNGAEVDRAGVDVVEIWGKPAHEWHEQVAVDHGFHELRSLHQMRCALPVGVDPLPTRAFRPHTDDETLRLLNNAAFEGHPDQGDLSSAAFATKLAEPGVSPEGIRIYEADGSAKGFCWTKIHHDQGLGEIFAIGLHPSVHGRGLGAPMTAAGLDWLASQGLETGMLYVEADNGPAIRTYRRLGFEIVRTDRAWSTTLRPETNRRG